MTGLKISYQWYKNNIAIAGAVAETYQTSILEVADNDSRYHVVVSNGNNSINSAQAVLTVLAESDILATEEVIKAPSTLDTAMSDSFGSYFVEINNSISHKEKLFIFFPASGSNPSMDLFIIRQAALNGFHVIGFPYANKDVVAILCGSSSDKSCQAKIREETFSGTDVSTEVDVDQVNSVNNRLVAILKFLDQNRSSENWGQFLNGNEIKWDKIRLSGHSQGGGLAAYIAIKKQVDRVCTFSSPADFDKDLNEPANWVNATGMTNSSRYYGFGSIKDNIVPWANLQKIWAKLGMDTFGAAVDVDTASSGFSGSHMFSTNQGSAANGHGVPVVDAYTPLDSNGQPIFKNVWQYLCFL